MEDQGVSVAHEEPLGASGFHFLKSSNSQCRGQFTKRLRHCPATGTEKFREFRWCRGQDLTLGTAGWEKPSFLTHSEAEATKQG